MKLTFTQEKRGEIERIQRGFANQLSEKEILKATASGINDALKSGIVNKQLGLKTELKQKYNLQNKHLKDCFSVFPRANAYKLWGGVEIKTPKLRLMEFNPIQSGSSISVEIQRGKKVTIRNSFIATMASGHTGVFARGYYKDGKRRRQFEWYTREQRRKGGIGLTIASNYKKKRITEIYTSSIYTMSVSKLVGQRVSEYMGREAVARVNVILTYRVNKIAQGNG